MGVVEEGLMSGRTLGSGDDNSMVPMGTNRDPEGRTSDVILSLGFIAGVVTDGAV